MNRKSFGGAMRRLTHVIALGILACLLIGGLVACGGGADLNDDGTLVKVHDEGAPDVPSRCTRKDCK